MRVPAEVLEDLRRSAEGTLRVDHPLLPVEAVLERSKSRGIGQPGTRAAKIERLSRIEFRETVEELPTKDSGHRGHREEEAAVGRNPPHAVVIETAARHDAMDVRMKA